MINYPVKEVAPHDLSKQIVRDCESLKLLKQGKWKRQVTGAFKLQTEDSSAVSIPLPGDFDEKCSSVAIISINWATRAARFPIIPSPVVVEA